MELYPVLTLDEIQEDNPMPSRNHAQISQLIGYYLQAHYGEQLEIYQQLSLNLDGWRTIPDVCAYPKSSLPFDLTEDEVEVTKPPGLVIEILSPFQNLQPLVQKMKKYLEAGVSSCWLVTPMTHAILTYAPGMIQRSFYEGELCDDVMNIAIPLDEVFH